MKVAAETRQLTKCFKDFWGRQRAAAIRDVTFRIPSGCVFGLLGPNGSGKTTTLKLLTGLLHPTQGTVSVLGEPPRSTAVRRQLGYLPETSGFYRYLCAREHLLFYAGLFGLPRREARRRCEELLERVHLLPEADRPVGEFSKGMNRRLGLAQALINDPEILVLDEPTSGLDPAGCRLVKELLRSHAAHGRTVIVSSHLLADVEDICNAVCILNRGLTVAVGELDRLLDRQDQIRFTTDAVDENQREALQRAFKAITGHEAGVDHPRLALETFFSNAVRTATPPESNG